MSEALKRTIEEIASLKNRLSTVPAPRSSGRQIDLAMALMNLRDAEAALQRFIASGGDQ